MTTVRARGTFPDTRWSVVLRARGDGASEGAAEQALAELCAAYWYPLYAYARGCGQAPADAEDLTQGFFGRLVARDLLAKADPAKGRLRSFLLGSFKRFMSEEWHQANRLKRGGGQVFIPIDQVLAEEQYQLSDGDGLSPEARYDRLWFHSLIEKALNELQQEHRRRDKGQLFERLQGYLAWDRGEASLGELARELRLSPGALRVTIFRMRHRFRTLLEQQVADTVGSSEEVLEELEALRRSVGA